MKIKKDSLYLSFLLLFIIWYDNIKQKGENMDNKYDCELIHFNLCLGCTGLAEKDWVGKYQCEHYKKWKKRLDFNNQKKGER